MMTAEQLKGSILNLAFSGKLVNQRNNEESPVGLLYHLASNNLKNKKIIQIVRKQDGLHYSLQNNRMICVEEDLLFDIPSTWEWTSLKNVSFILYGFPFDSGKFNDYGDGVPLIRIRDVLPGFTKTYTTEKCSDDYVIENGDMLVGMDGNFNVNFWSGGTAYLNQRVCRIKTREEILDQKYLSYYLPLEFDRIAKSVSYVTVRHLSDKHLSSLFIPVPPLAEQKRIVAKIEELMCFVEQYTAASTKLNTLNAMFPEMMKKSTLQEAVQGKLVPQDPNDEPASVLLKRIAGEKKRLIKEGKIKKQKTLPEITEDEIPFDIPESWEWVRLSTIAYKIVDGTHHSPSNYERGEYMYVTAKNIKSWGVVLDNITYVSKSIHDEIYSRCNPEKGDVLRIKDGATTGVVTVNNIEEPFSMLSSVALIKLPELIEPWYIVAVLQSDLFYKNIRAQMKGTGITRITLKQIEPLLIPIPPAKEQKSIVMKLRSILPVIDAI